MDEPEKIKNHYENIQKLIERTKILSQPLDNLKAIPFYQSFEKIYEKDSQKVKLTLLQTGQERISINFKSLPINLRPRQLKDNKEYLNFIVDLK